MYTLNTVPVYYDLPDLKQTFRNQVWVTFQIDIQKTLSNNRQNHSHVQKK